MKKKYKCRHKPPIICPYFIRPINKAKTYKAISCKACEYAIGFSDNMDKVFLSPRTYNNVYINTYTGGNIQHARDEHIKQYCKGRYTKCKYFQLSDAKLKG